MRPARWNPQRFQRHDMRRDHNRTPRDGPTPICKLCGNRGHIAIACPSTPCLVCQDPGHATGHASKPVGVSKLNKCFTCGGGRTQSPGLMEKGRKICYNCRGEGHESRDCKAPDPRICYRCGGKGHIAATCRKEVPQDRRGLPKFTRVHEIQIAREEEHFDGHYCDPDDEDLSDFDYPITHEGEDRIASPLPASMDNLEVGTS